MVKIDGNGKDKIFEDRANIMAMSRFEFEENDKSQTVCLGIEYLKKLLTVLETMGTDCVFVTVQNDYPIILRTNKDSRIALVLAPRIVD